MCFRKKKELTGGKCIQRILFPFKAKILIISFAVILVITAFFVSNYFHREKKVTVTIDQGTLVGEESLDYWNETFYSFKGIPFAKPPIGELRFKAPEPAEPWSGIYDATKSRSSCPQTFSVDDESYLPVEQSEDCLFLTVHSKMSSVLQPVMVFIFGGCFEYGSVFDERYGPQFLMTEGIVLVRISYRLSVFGFSAMDDPKYGIHGNMGFKDQVLALKWIQNNIQHFGGDPNQVTIFGQSAGAISVDLLCLSPLAEGLFHRAILQSGAIGFTVLSTPHKFIHLAKPLGCFSSKKDETVKCINKTTTKRLLQSLKALELTPHYNEILKYKQNYGFNILTIENRSCCGSFLVDKPENILRKGKFKPVPTIMGFNTHESSMFIPYHQIKPNFTDNRALIPQDLIDKVDLESEKAIILGNMIKELYYGNQTPSNELMDPFMDYLTDIMFVHKIYQSAKLHSMVSKTAPVWFYHLNMNINPSQNVINHESDLQYLFYMKGITPVNLDKSSETYIRIYRMIKLWTTFAKTGDPNPVNDPLLPVKWLPFQPNKYNYLKIEHHLELNENPLEKRMAFWENFYAELNEDN